MLNYTSENGSLELSMHLIGEKLLILPERLCAPPIFIGVRVAQLETVLLYCYGITKHYVKTSHLYRMREYK
jgi:hypothetical protein